MATNSEKIDDLIRLVTQMVSRVDKIETEGEWASDWVEKLRLADEEFRLRVSALERVTEDSRKSRDEWSRRIWSLVVPIVTAIVGLVLGYFLKR